jgi:hypothetical protein
MAVSLNFSEGVASQTADASDFGATPDLALSGPVEFD